MTAVATDEGSAAGRPKGRRPIGERDGRNRDGRSSSDDRRTYRYRAIDGEAGLRDGELRATSEAEALARLRQLGLRPVSVRARRGLALDQDYSLPGIGPRVKARELAVLTRQLATMMSAGIPLLRSLEVLRRQSQNSLLTSTIEQIELDIESGESLSQAIQRHPKVFDHLYVSMVRAGEAAGALDTVLDQLATTLERAAAMRQKIRSAMSYPVVVSVMVVAVVVAMLVFVVPTFASIYDDLGGTLPLPTRVLVATSGLLTGQLPLVVMVALTAGFGFRRWSKSSGGRYRLDGLKLAAPIVGPLARKSALGRFGRTMAVLTRAGVPVLETLRITSETVGNAVLARAIDTTRDAVGRGEPMAEQLERSGEFPALVVQLVSVGEESGALDQMFEIIGTSFEEETETAVAGFAALIEPVMMAVIGVVVGGIVVALYLPMFRIIDLVQ